MTASRSSLFQSVQRWIAGEARIKSAVLFGSTANTDRAETAADQWSDFDLHLVVTAPREFPRIEWSTALPDEEFRFQALRPATGGVQKLTVVFAGGQMDLILVPHGQMAWARLGFKCGWEKRSPRLLTALNEIHTCLRGGYQFLKGEGSVGSFYRRVSTEMSGVRLSDAEASALAKIAWLDLHWIRQKIERGEWLAAQHGLHRSVGETNLRLVRELRLRRGEPLPSFGLGRHVESLLSPEERTWVTIDTRCTAEGLRSAANRAEQGLVALMAALVPSWSAPSF